jgi:dihydrofolate synthase/folylpolyglutamate synthase
VLILEVGLGGRLDAVNAYTPDCAVVCSIALDHTDWLGSDREAIGFEKAGIFRAGRAAFCADPEPPQSLLAHARKIGAELQVIGRDFGCFGDSLQWTFWRRGGLRRAGLAQPTLRGAGQLRNAAVTLAVVESLRPRLPVDMLAVRRGLLDLDLAGRFQVLAGRPTVVLDVAHNPQAVCGLAEKLAELPFAAQTIAVVGMLADKDIAGSLASLAGRVDHWLLADLDVPRGASAAALAAVVRQCALGGAVECHPSAVAAYRRSAELAGENDRIVVFGSFYTVAAVMRSRQNGR